MMESRRTFHFLYLSCEDSCNERRMTRIALAGVLLGALTYIAIRAVGKQAHPLHLLTFFSMQCVIMPTTYMIATESPFFIPTRLGWLGLVALIGFLGFIAQILLAMGRQCETASRSTLALHTQIIYTVILEWIFFQSTPSMLSICGTLIIITSALYDIQDSSTVVLDQLDEQTLEEGLLENRNAEPEEPTPEDKHLMPRHSIELCNVRA
ncbi:hypothetical protein BD779DRAFT_899142 [Infundibulicybe gibba]|nr:hypothetical protein BD779DRAFT_899142 [Infundibulicybe gibba]